MEINDCFSKNDEVNLKNNDNEKKTLDLHKKGHLSLQGIGPVYVSIIIAATVGAIVLVRSGAFEFGHVRNFKVKILMDFSGFFIIFIGYILYVEAVFFSKIIREVKSNHLVTDGVYKFVRNPVYSGFLLVCSGVILLCHNLYLLWLPVLYWLLLTVLVSVTEERWLLKLYGDEYKEYCSKVNRCIPWIGRE